MKTIKYFTYRIMAVAAIAIAFALPAKAQITAQLQISVAYFCSIGLYFLV